MPTFRHLYTMSKWNFAVPATIAILASALLTGCSSAPSGDISTPVSSPAVRDAPTGQEVFAASCAVCHGGGGEGQPDWHERKEDGTLPPPPLNGDGHTWHHADGLLYRIVSQGGSIFEDPRYPSFKSGMPAFGDRLSHQEIIAVFTYIKSLWGDETQRGMSIRESQELVSNEDPFPSGGK